MTGPLRLAGVLLALTTVWPTAGCPAETEPDGDEPMACVALPSPMGWPSDGVVVDRVDARSEDATCPQGQFIGVEQDTDGQVIYTNVTQTPWRQCRIGRRWTSTRWAGGCE